MVGFPVSHPALKGFHQLQARHFRAFDKFSWTKQSPRGSGIYSQSGFLRSFESSSEKGTGLDILRVSICKSLAGAWFGSFLWLC